MSVHAARAKFWLFTILLAFVALAPGWATADRDDDRHGSHRPFDRIVVFGDSLSDPGNAFALNGGQTVSAPGYGMTELGANNIPEVVTLIPDAPYSSHRFSNGRTWIEVLAGEIGLARNARPAVAGALFGEDGRASNYAVGGATAANLTAFGGSEFHLAVQVDLFLDDVKKYASSDALYVIAIGGNDIRAALAGVPGAINLALGSVGQNIGKLYGAGARKFLVWNAPDLGRAPAITRLDAVVCAPPFRVPAAPGCVITQATGASAAYNTGLTGPDGVLQGLGALPGITIVQFDTFGSLATIQANPRKFGLRDATSACIEPNVPQFGFPSSPPFRCAQPDRHFFWDGIHPTRGGHRVIADLVGKVLRELVFDD